jgi:hypothetical protein
LIDIPNCTLDTDGSYKVIAVIHNARATLAIQHNVIDENSLMLMEFKTTPLMWYFLFQEFSGKNESRKFSGIKKIALFRYEKATLKENIQELKKLVL